MYKPRKKTTQKRKRKRIVLATIRLKRKRPVSLSKSLKETIEA